MKANTLNLLMTALCSVMIISCDADPIMPDKVFNAKHPSVETLEILEFTDTTATVRLEVISNNGAEITECGVEYGMSEADFAYSQKASSEIGEATLHLANLQINQTYFVRAFAKNSVGTAYGDTLTFNTSNGQWERVSAYPGSTFFPGSAAYFSSEDVAYILGGDLGASYSDEFWSFSTIDNKWTTRFSFTKQPRKWQSSVVLDDIAYFFGGIDANGTSYNDLHFYRTLDNSWITLDAFTPPPPTHSASAVPVDDYFCIVGGNVNGAISNEVWIYIPLYRSWLQRGDFPVAQNLGMAVNIDDVIYAGLGQIDEFTTYERRIWASNDEAQSWTEETTLPDEAGEYRSAVIFDKSIFILDSDGQIWKYNPINKRWNAEVKISSSKDNDVHCMYAIGEYIYVGLGSDGKTLMRYKPET